MMLNFTKILKVAVVKKENMKYIIESIWYE